MRSPQIVMDLKRLGSMHQTRISFVRSLIRKMAAQKWKFTLNRWDMDDHGFGTVIYQLDTPNNIYQVVIFPQYIPDEERNDRVIADKWDCTFVLIQGKINDDLLKNLRKNAPLQEAGRYSKEILVLSRANKSIRVFDHIVDRLANGQQPDIALLQEVGYILRTTAVYGNGKFGLLDYFSLMQNPDFNLSFSAQLCAVYILRQFSIDWVHFLAKKKGGNKAIELDRKLQTYLGTGNATGLGMSLFLIRHPLIVNAWLNEREQALSKTIKMPITAETSSVMDGLLKRASEHLYQVFTINEHQKKLNLLTSKQIPEVIEYVDKALAHSDTWESVLKYSEQYCLEAQEIVISCLLELYPELVDEHVSKLIVDERYASIHNITVAELVDIIDTNYNWVHAIDFENSDSQYWFWYVSENKLEPRLGSRYEERGQELELPLDIARQVKRLYPLLTQVLNNDLQEQLSDQSDMQGASKSVNKFLLDYPEHHDLIRRIVTMSNSTMGEIQANVIDKDILPMDLLRAKLSMFGATKFDPRSDRWVRITLFQNAPLFDELHQNEWQFPVLQGIF